MSYNVFSHDTIGSSPLTFLYQTSGPHTLFNNTIVSGGVIGNGIDIGDTTTATVKNNITKGFATSITSDVGVTLTEDYNNAYGYATASGLTGTNSITTNPLFTSSSDYTLTYLSSAIDAGTDVGFTQDFLGNSIYGTPDIGAYEYQPPYAMRTNEISTTAPIRTYGDEKFRNKEAPDNAITADLDIEIPNSDTSEWLDIEISSWGDTKTWTEETTQSLTDTVHVVGDLEANKNYEVSVDSVLGQDITGDNCTSGVCTSNASGQITFTYGGTYSSHTFSVSEGDNTSPVLSFTDSISSEKTKADKIEVSWGDATVKKWDYDSDGSCSTTSGDYSKTDSDSMDQDDRDHQDKYICLYAEDSLGNQTTLASENKINISNELDIDDVEYSSTKDTITIKWDTNNDADSKVKYGTADGHLDEKETSSKEENHHKTVLEDLKSNTIYYFRIYSEDEYGDEEKTKVYSIKTKKDYAYYSSSATVPTSIIPQEEFNFTPKEEEESYNGIAQDIQEKQEMNKQVIPEEEPIEKDEPSFWVRIWNFFKGLFGG